MTHSAAAEQPRGSASSQTEDAASGAAAQQKAEEVLRAHDISSRFRTDLGWWGWIVGGVAIVFTVYHLYAAFERPYNAWMHGSLHVAGALALTFLLYPASKRLLHVEPTGNKVVDVLTGRHRGVPWYDVVLAAVATVCSFYIFFNYEYLVSNQVAILGYSDTDILVATLGVLLVLEASRRCVGTPIVVVAGVAIAYALFATGARMPGDWGHRGQDWSEFATNMFLSANQGVFGTPIRVSSEFIFLFLFFAVVLLRTNIGQFFNDLAFRAAGRFSGGPAKAAVAASGLQGMVSGSSVANTVASGSFTIPIMKRAGFKPHVAAATEATASTGGQMVPPIMGAAAFIMAQNISGLEYNELIVIAIIPAALYFTGAFLSVHFEAKRNELKGIPPAELPSWKSIITRIDMLLPLVVIISTLLGGASPMRAALFGIGTALALSLLRAVFDHLIPVLSEATKDGKSPVTETGKLLLALVYVVAQMLVAGARTALPVIAACATAGMVAGTVTSTGLGGQLGAGLVNLAGGNFLLVLVMVMVACIILGMGLPTTANYVVTATVAAPILYQNFDVPLIAAHMFVFFFGILADVTPPVCLAAFAGAGIAGANPMRAGVSALRMAVAGFLIPYAFILEPALLLEGTFTELMLALGTVILGMIGVSSGLAGYLIARGRVLDRTLLVVGGIMLIYPDVIISGVGLGVVAAGVAIQAVLRARGYKADMDSAEEVHIDLSEGTAASQ
ncbi:TRAP transporter permease [Nesterenkonia sphaerica]|uniref:TRAP transporter permease n=1 Tax=Nesterenkonia sphaerica TaxID=1804988 RepID=A0A5R9ACF4_9MICC|nr:TRAP transporter permease [Nesterenkonia sphaerica]TLP75824.1 TRAP transporter permease [Nesterenkonia sphaerica]